MKPISKNLAVYETYGTYFIDLVVYETYGLSAAAHHLTNSYGNSFKVQRQGQLSHIGSFSRCFYPKQLRVCTHSMQLQYSADSDFHQCVLLGFKTPRGTLCQLRINKVKVQGQRKT